jgi:hypothetical protein
MDHPNENGMNNACAATKALMASDTIEEARDLAEAIRKSSE